MLIGGSIDTQLGKDLQRLWEGFPLTMLILGRGQSTLIFERIHKDFGTIPSDNVDPGMGGGVHQHSTWKGSTKTLEDCLWQCWSQGGVDWHSTWKGSTKTLGGFPLTMLIRGSIDTQLGKDLQRLWEDSLWQCWSWGGVDRHSTWKGSAKTLGGFPLTMLIGGSIDTQLGKDLQRLWKDCLWQCWSSGQWGVNTQLGKDPQRLREDCLWQCWSGGSIDTQLGKDPPRLWKDCLWQCWSWGVDQHLTWKGSTKTLKGFLL